MTLLKWINVNSFCHLLNQTMIIVHQSQFWTETQLSHKMCIFVQKQQYFKHVILQTVSTWQQNLSCCTNQPFNLCRRWQSWCIKFDGEFYNDCVTMQLLDCDGFWRNWRPCILASELAWIHVLWLHWSKPIKVCVIGRRSFLHWLTCEYHL